MILGLLFCVHAIGSVYANQCSAQQIIPVYLQVNGVICHIVLTIVSLCVTISTYKCKAIVAMAFNIIYLIVGLFAFAWLIAGKSELGILCTVSAQKSVTMKQKIVHLNTLGKKLS